MEDRSRPSGKLSNSEWNLAAPIPLSKDLTLEIWSFLDGYSLVVQAIVCKEWSNLANSHSCSKLWRSLCAHIWWSASMEALTKRVSRKFLNDWKLMYFKQPHCRFDGIYILKATYMTAPSAEKRDRMPNEISYYRYLRFYPRGKCVYALLNYDFSIASNWFRYIDLIYRDYLYSVDCKTVKEKPFVPTKADPFHPNSPHSVPGFPVDFPSFVEKIHLGQYKIVRNGIKLKVNIGHMVLDIRLNFCNPVRESNDRFELLSLVGKIPNENNTVVIPSPSLWFFFKKFDW